MADLTKADAEALALLPSGWFHIDKVTYRVLRPYWRCQRLVALGVLERRHAGTYPTLFYEYRRATDGVPSDDPASTAARLDWCIRTLIAMKKLGRFDALGDHYPELIAVIGALKVVASSSGNAGVSASPGESISGEPPMIGKK